MPNYNNYPYGMPYQPYQNNNFNNQQQINQQPQQQIPFMPLTFTSGLVGAKAWLEDEDLHIEPSEKVCKYLYEIVLADED